jgi:hypothetical protein
MGCYCLVRELKPITIITAIKILLKCFMKFYNNLVNYDKSSNNVKIKNKADKSGVFHKYFRNSFIKEISTLLLCAFPAEVLLVSIGLVSPKPVEFNLSFTVFNQIILTAAALFR